MARKYVTYGLAVASILALAVSMAASQELPPKVTANGKQLSFTGSGFSFKTKDSETTISEIMTAINDIKNDFQKKLTGQCTSSMISEIDPDGTVRCYNDQIIPSLQGQVNRNQDLLPTVCQLSEWSDWTACSAECNGTSIRRRTIVREANNSVPCSEFVMEQTRVCSPPCDDEPDEPMEFDPCNGNERWYNLNSGTEQTRIASYVAQTIVIGRDAGPNGFAFKLTLGTWNAGEVKNVGESYPGGIQPGDWICGTVGDVEVSSKQGNAERDWVPARVNGTEFVIPCTRAQPQKLYIIAPWEQAKIDLYFDGTTAARTMWLERTQVYSFDDIRRNNRNIRLISTGRILVSYVAGSGGGGPVSFTGSTDYIVMNPASNVVYGTPSSGYVTTLRNSSAVTVQSTCSNNRNQTINVPYNQYRSVAQSASHYAGAACRITGSAGTKIGATSVGDRDGSEGTMWFPAYMMRRYFIVTAKIEHMALTCIGTGTARISPAVGQNPSETRTIVGTTLVTKAYTTTASSMNAGVFVNSSVPCFMVVDGDLEGDEYIVYGTNTAPTM